jgi:hypothetical protein
MSAMLLEHRPPKAPSSPCLKRTFTAEIGLSPLRVEFQFLFCGARRGSLSLRGRRRFHCFPFESRRDRRRIGRCAFRALHPGLVARRRAPWSFRVASCRQQTRQKNSYPTGCSKLHNDFRSE